MQIVDQDKSPLDLIQKWPYKNEVVDFCSKY
jgi:hypothetical protein